MKKLGLFLASILFIIVVLGIPQNEVRASILDFFYRTKEILIVSGNKVFLDDKALLLRGVAVGDPHSRVVVNRRTEKDYEVIKDDWHANVVRISVHPGLFHKDEKETKELLEEEIERARDKGLFVIVDWHVIGVPNGWYKSWDWGKIYGYSYDSNFNTARDFWKYMAIEYRSDRGVIFELWNEPANDGNLYWKDINGYMQRLYNTIRANGASNIVIAPGVWWTYDLRGIKDNPLEGDNIGYAWHNYPGSGGYLRWDIALDGLEEKYPIFITEWGFNTDTKANPHHRAKLDDWPVSFKNYILDKNLNFTAWCWHNPWDPRMLESNWIDLTDFGRFTKDFIINIDNGSAYLKLNDSNLNNISSEAQDNIINFIQNGVDNNSINLGEGERRAVVFSFQKAFNRLPEDEADMEDIKKIANGRWPTQRSEASEQEARNRFREIYKREANYNNAYDVSAIMIMSYGLKQRAENRNLNSERAGITIYKSIFGTTPSSTEDWNVMQAITYSGASR